MKDSGDKGPFADVNPFLNLDRSLFRNPAERGGHAAGKGGQPSAAARAKEPGQGCAAHPRPGKGGAGRASLPDVAQPEENMRAAFLGQDEQQAEAEIFMRAMSAVKPLAGKGREVAPVVVARPRADVRESAFDELLEGKLEFAEMHKGEYMEGHVVGLDALIMQKLRAGAYSPEAHIDLHGLNAEQAFMALREFFRRLWGQGARLALVVTGRGRNSPQGVGVLRDKMHLWLTQEPLKRIVLAFCTACPGDGGPGSIYVLLRKFRKKGKIYWDRPPPDGF